MVGRASWRQAPFFGAVGHLVMPCAELLQNMQTCRRRQLAFLQVDILKYVHISLPITCAAVGLTNDTPTLSWSDAFAEWKGHFAVACAKRLQFAQ